MEDNANWKPLGRKSGIAGWAERHETLAIALFCIVAIAAYTLVAQTVGLMAIGFPLGILIMAYPFYEAVARFFRKD